jgi:hypothetical protein
MRGTDLQGNELGANDGTNAGARVARTYERHPMGNERPRQYYVIR